MSEEWLRRNIGVSTESENDANTVLTWNSQTNLKIILKRKHLSIQKQSILFFNLLSIIIDSFKNKT